MVVRIWIDLTFSQGGEWTRFPVWLLIGSHTEIRTNKEKLLKGWRLRAWWALLQTPFPSLWKRFWKKLSSRDPLDMHLMFHKSWVVVILKSRANLKKIIDFIALYITHHCGITTAFDDLLIYGYIKRVVHVFAFSFFYLFPVCGVATYCSVFASVVIPVVSSSWCFRLMTFQLTGCRRNGAFGSFKNTLCMTCPLMVNGRHLYHAFIHTIDASHSTNSHTHTHEPVTLWLPDDCSYLLSHCRPISLVYMWYPQQVISL